MTVVTLTTGGGGLQQWTPPGDCATIDLLELWGPGGSGAKETAARNTGGGGGAYNTITGPITIASLLASSGLSTVPYVIGQGGAAVSVANTVGNPGSAKTQFLVPAAIAIDAYASAPVTGNAVVTLSNNNLTVGAGATSMVAILCFEGGTAPTAFTVQWDSGGTPQAMTQIHTGNAVGLSNFIFGLVNPTPGNKTLTASWTTSQTGAVMTGVSFVGTISSSVANAFATSNVSSGTATSVNANITTNNAVGQLGIGLQATATSITTRGGTGSTVVLLDSTAGMGASAVIIPEVVSFTPTTATWTGSQAYLITNCHVKPAVAPYSADFGLGGKTAASGTVAGGTGGLVANSLPTAGAKAGADGGTTTVTTGSSGGGSSPSASGNAVAGAAVTTGVAGAGGTAPSDGGSGGAGGITSSNSTAGSAPGGGGGGHLTATGNSGAGANGQIVITYTPAAAGVINFFPDLGQPLPVRVEMIGY